LFQAAKALANVEIFPLRWARPVSLLLSISWSEGYRLIVQRDGNRVRLFTRNGHEQRHVKTRQREPAGFDFVLRRRRLAPAIP
jgi:hypothetical protein